MSDGPDQLRRASPGRGAWRSDAAAPRLPATGVGRRGQDRRRRSRRAGDGSAAPSPPPTRGRPGPAPRTSGASSGRRAPPRPRRRAGPRDRSGCRGGRSRSSRASPSSKVSARRRWRRRMRVRLALLGGRALRATPAAPLASPGGPLVDLGLGRLVEIVSRPRRGASAACPVDLGHDPSPSGRVAHRRPPHVVSSASRGVYASGPQRDRSGRLSRPDRSNQVVLSWV